MSYQSYRELVSKVAALLNRPDLEGSIPEWLQLVESEFMKECRDITENLTEGTPIAMVVDQDYIDLPAGAGVVKMLRIDTTPEKNLRIVSQREMDDNRIAKRGQTFPVSAMFTGATKLSLAPPPQTTDTVTPLYSTSFADIDQDSTDNRLLIEAPEMLLYGAAVHGCNFTEEFDTGARFAAVYQDAKAKYKKWLARKRMSGGKLRVRAFPAATHDGHVQRWR